MRLLSVLFVTMTLLVSCTKEEVETDPVNSISNDRMLLVLAAPSVYEPYYRSTFNDIVDFQIDYANKIIGNDNVVILVDADTKRYYDGKVPDDVLLTADIYDIWARDFTTVSPENPVSFKYTWASMTEQESIEVKKSFNVFANAVGLDLNESNILIDGGNIVDNYKGKVITTTRFLQDNNLTYNEGVTALKGLLNATKVAIIEPDEEVLAHADGMVSWVDENVLLVNDYKNDTIFANLVMQELQKAFPTTTLVKVPVVFDDNNSSQWGNIGSACGVNLNATLTYNNIYVPTFNMPHDQATLDLFKANSSKNIIPVYASGVCEMGGSVRCLTWQLIGVNAEKVILAARKN